MDLALASPRRLAAALAVAGALLAGCGGGDDDEPGRTATFGVGAGVKVVGDEYSFDPETVVVPTQGGQAELTITLQNDGALAHNLRIFRDGREIGGTTTFQGGKSRSANVTLEPGGYEMICTVGNHAELGMTGTLEVG